MSLVVLTWVMGAALAPSGDLPPSLVSVRIVTMQATLEDRPSKLFDPEVEGMRAAVSDLEFDTYRTLNITTVSSQLNDETQIQLTPKYTLYVTPLSRERNGHVRVSVRVEMPPREEGGKPVNAVSTTLVIGPGKQFKLRGLKNEDGELVIVISLKKG